MISIAEKDGEAQTSQPVQDETLDPPVADRPNRVMYRAAPAEVQDGGAVGWLQVAASFAMYFNHL